MTRDGDFLSRWSQRKHAAKRGEAAPEPVPDRLPAGAVPAAASIQSPGADGTEPKALEPIPPVESLTPESDFTPFMRKDIDPGLRRAALRTLFRDPRFNVMDGLDVYIDDFSKPDPIPADWLGKLNQMARLGDYVPPEAPPEEAQKPAETAQAEPIQALNQELESTSPTQSPDAIEDGSPAQESPRS